MLAQTITFLRYVVAFVWIYAGLVPKFVRTPADEQLALEALISVQDAQQPFMMFLGGLEVSVGILLFVFYRSRALLLFAMTLCLVSIPTMAFVAPSMLTETFNPISTNLLLIAVMMVLYQDARNQQVEPVDEEIAPEGK